LGQAALQVAAAQADVAAAQADVAARAVSESGGPPTSEPQDEQPPPWASRLKAFSLVQGKALLSPAEKAAVDAFLTDEVAFEGSLDMLAGAAPLDLNQAPADMSNIVEKSSLGATEHEAKARTVRMLLVSGVEASLKKAGEISSTQRSALQRYFSRFEVGGNLSAFEGKSRAGDMLDVYEAVRSLSNPEAHALRAAASPAATLVLDWAFPLKKEISK